MPEKEYDPPGISTFSFVRSEDARDGFIDLMNDMGVILKERKLVDTEVRLPQRKLKIDYGDYAKRRPCRKYSSNWIDDGDHIAGMHPKTYLPFFMNSSGSAIYRMCEGKLNIEDIFGEFKRIWPSVSDCLLLEDLLSFLLLLEEIDVLDYKG